MERNPLEEECEALQMLQEMPQEMQVEEPVVVDDSPSMGPVPPLAPVDIEALF